MAVTTTEGAFISRRLAETIISGRRIPMASSMTMLDTTLELRELNAANDVANGRISERMVALSLVVPILKIQR